MSDTSEHDVRFSGGPFSWRKRYGPDFRIRMLDSTKRLEVPGKLRGVRHTFRSPDHFIEYMKAHRGEYSVGVYERIAPDRFVWRGWK